MRGNVHCNGHDCTDHAGDSIDPYHKVSRSRALCSEELISREISGDKEDDQASVCITVDVMKYAATAQSTRCPGRAARY